MHQNRFYGWGSTQSSLRELTARPQTPSWNKGDLRLREEKECRREEEDREGKAGKGMEEEVKATM